MVAAVVFQMAAVGLAGAEPEAPLVQQQAQQILAAGAEETGPIPRVLLAVLA